MMNALAEFFSPEAGQARRQWLNRQEDRVGNALAGYLGPAAQPIQSAAMLAGYLSPGADMMEAADASRGMWNADNPLDAAVAGATMLGATGMMLLPGNFNALQEGVGSVADDLVAAYDPAVMRVGMGPASETPAQEVARLLREGRAADVTDDMMARVDPQEMFRLYEAGATGADMPMDFASRMARAQDMGFSDRVHYHGARQPFDAFIASTKGMQGPGVYVTEIAEDASDYAMDHGVIGQNGIEVLIPRGRYASDQNVTDATFNRFKSDRSPTYQDAARSGVADLQAQGFVGAAVENVRPQYFQPTAENPLGVGVVQRNVFDPRNIRSRFARFDPRLAHLANLSAGIGGVAVGLNALAPTQENADRQVILDWLDSQGL